MQDKTKRQPEDKAKEPAKPAADELGDQALDTMTGGGGGLVPRVPGPAPQTP